MLDKLRSIKRALNETLKQFRYDLSVGSAELPHTCILCDKKVHEFEPLSSYYEDLLKSNGFPYPIEETETLNLQAYSCPRCGGSDRDRLYALFFRKQLEKDKTYKLLDIAPSRSLQTFLKRYHNVRYRSADLYMPGVDDKIDLADMHIYPDNSFDIFICSHVLEHVPDDLKAMRELYRVLRPGGWGIAMVPINKMVLEIEEDPSIEDEKERWRRFGQDDHVRLYSREGFKQRLQEVGFRVKEYSQKDFSTSEFADNAIDPQSILYIVYK